MSRYYEENIQCKVYVGDLNAYTSKQEVEDAFSYYGPIRSVWVARNPPGFAFVEYEDARDAQDAIKQVGGRRVINGRKVRAEKAGHRRDRLAGRFRSRGPPGGRFSQRSRGGRPFNSEDKCFHCGDRGHYARNCSKYGKGSKSRSGGRNRRSYSRSRTRSRSYSKDGSSRSRSDSRKRSYTKSPSSRRSSCDEKKRPPRSRYSKSLSPTEEKNK